ncbi:nucleotidyltransferase family protein [Tropicibacter oceani]|uniref:Nucleotidyltransferase family protein n=1 Tax=Tropicibacter oceani TaxID=3058420 RepID=A0ABY8QIV0_9RHOB|nr:nucleotidyltransferase family protein [Tropicibacter oceani]WGW04559.1 nucleotidyltransferase family protein [Tropicibacter oceani]
MPDAVMLFAAGFGTRMGALTKDRPKPLIEVAGRPLLDHALDLTRGLSTRVVNAHYHADQILGHLQGRDVTVSVETPEILDTGGGLRHALPLLGDAPVFTLNTDAIWNGPNPLDLLQAAWDPGKMDALLLCVPIAQAVGRNAPGDFTLHPSGRLIRQGDLVYTGAQIVKTDLLHDMTQPAFSLNLLWNRMAQDDRLNGLTYPGKWCDVGHPDGIALAEGVLRDG